ncbi:MAG: hypothetical protein ACKVT0_03135 [Planctomycetaceae bacterium]
MSRPLTGQAALRIFALGVAVLSAAGGLGYFCAKVLGQSFIDAGPKLPIPFWVSTCLLLLTSVLLQLALADVKRERQLSFRKRLWFALFSVTMFLAIQGYGLWGFVQRNRPEEATTGSEPFILAFAALHGAHVIVAVLVLVYVIVQGLSNRYDHEYYWGVVVCTFFWHALGWVWLCILGASLIAL